MNIEISSYQLFFACLQLKRPHELKCSPFENARQKNYLYMLFNSDFNLVTLAELFLAALEKSVFASASSP